MAEFRFELQPTSSPKKLIISALVLIALLVCVALYVRHNPSSSQLSPVISVPGVLRTGDTNFEYYKTKIHIEGIRASLGVNYNGARVAMIAGVVYNDGDRKIEALELGVTLYDERGNTVKKRTAFAVRPGVGFNPGPMEPIERRAFNVAVEGIDREWDPTVVSVEVTGLKYR